MAVPTENKTRCQQVRADDPEIGITPVAGAARYMDDLVLFGDLRRAVYRWHEMIEGFLDERQG